MFDYEMTKDERKAECKSPSRLLSWETGEITSLEDTLLFCNEVDICELDCKCRLREAYHFYLSRLDDYE